MTATSTQPARHVLDTAGSIAGVRTDEAELIRDGSNALYRLPTGVVARIGQTGSQQTAQREVQVSRWLAANDFPVVRAITNVQQPTMVADQPVTWWALLPEHRSATPTELGAVLRALHALPIPEQIALPEVEPFAELADRIATAQSLSTNDQAWLAEHLAKLRDAYSDLPAGLPHCVVHGDAWQGNIAVPACGTPILLDLENVSLGHPEWDLVSLAVDCTDFKRITAEEYRTFVNAYGGYDVTEWPGYRTLAAIRELRWTCFVLNKANANTAAEHETRHRIACLRGEIPHPWSWSAF